MADTTDPAAQSEAAADELSPEKPSSDSPDSSINPADAGPSPATEAAAASSAAEAPPLPEQPSDGQAQAGSELPGDEATQGTAELAEATEGEVSPEATGSDSIAAIVASGISKTSIGTKTIGGKTFKRIGTELVPMVRLPKWQLEETADRLSKPKEHIKEKNARPKAVHLTYEFDKSLRGGKGGYREVLAPAKKLSQEEKQEYMVTLAERCKESKQKTKDALREKYLQPLQPNVKKIPKEEMDQHIAKMDNLFHGKGIAG